jgi:tetratricopeptide (TPR) repeat protein
MLGRLPAVLLILLGFAMAAPTASARQDDKRLDALFDRLQKTSDAQEARMIEGLIWSIWFRSGDATRDRLLERGNEAMNAGKLTDALAQFNAVIEADPKLAEAWNRRATLHYLLGNLDASVRDIEQTLALEPRHFGALSGLGLIYIQREQYDAAIRAFERSLKVNPHMPGAKQSIEDLRKRIGKDI